MIDQKRAKNIILLFLALDVFLLLRLVPLVALSIPALINAIGSSSESGMLLPLAIESASLLSFLLLSMIIYGFVFEKKFAFYLYYVHFPFRILFGLLSFGFISYLGKLLGSSLLFTALLYLAGILEVARFILTIMIQKPVFAAWGEHVEPEVNRAPRSGTARLLSNLTAKIKQAMFDREFSVGVFALENIKSYTMQMLMTFIMGIIPCLIVLWLIALDGETSNLRMNWDRFWIVMPYVVVALAVYAMFAMEGEKERRLSAIIFLSSVIILVPLDVFLSGIDQVLSFAGYGFGFGAAASALYFSVITVHSYSDGSQSISDNFNSASFISALLLSLFTTFIGIYGHAVITLLKLF